MKENIQDSTSVIFKSIKIGQSVKLSLSFSLYLLISVNKESGRIFINTFINTAR